MLKASLESSPPSNQGLLDEFKIQASAKMYCRLPDYDNSQGFDLSDEVNLAATPKSTMVGFPKPSWLPRKHYLFNAHIRKKLFVAIRENATKDMKDGEFKQERLFRRVDKRHIPETSIGLAGMEFVDYGD